MRTLARVGCLSASTLSARTLTARTLLVAAGFAAGLPAMADMPKVLDRVSPQTPMVAVVDSIESLEAKMKMFGDAEDVSKSVLPEEARNLLAIEGLNKAGSLALMVWPKEKASKAEDKDGEDMPGLEGAPDMDDMMEQADIVGLLPVSDYKAFIAGLKAEAGEGGVSKFTFNTTKKEMGQDGDQKEIVDPVTMYVKDAGGGYAAVSPGKEFLTSYKPAEGQMAEQVKFLGKVGATIEARTDLMLLTNVSKIKDGITKGVAEMKKGAGDQMAMMGEAAQNAEKGLDMVAMVVNNWARDGRVAIIGQGMSEKGLSIDIGTEFSEGTELAKTFAGEAKGVTTLNNVPDVPFMLAVALDASSPVSKQLYQGMLDLAGNDKSPGMASGMRMAKDSEAFATVMGAPPAGAMGGLFTQTISYMQTKEPAKMLESAQAMMTEMNGQQAEGITYKTKYKKAVKELGGVKVDSWEMAMEMDPNKEGAQMMQMMQGMIMGAGPMKGFYGASGEGVVYSMAANEPLMAMALDTAKTGKGLGTNELVKQVRSELPANSSLEVYVGVKPLGDMALGFAAMAVGPVDLEIPDSLPPVGIGASLGSSGVHARVFIPSAVLKFGAEAAKQMEAMREDGMNDMDDMNGEPAANDEEGAPPKF